MRANGIPVQRHGDRCTLNHGNGPGEYVHVKSTATHDAPDGRDQMPWYKKAWDGVKGGAGDFLAGAKATSGTVATGEGLLDKASQYWSDPSQNGRDARSAYESIPTGSEIWEGTKNIAGGVAHVAGEVVRDPVGSTQTAGGWAKDQAVGAWSGATPITECWARRGP
ncbi:hypothetical protein ASG60_17050 [Methylobacterium sp. Leaf469]|uniref:hypothetical protein n=1 Tax=Methylobacterium sp. Leaf469 TaxID=1736387 RepID=UPI0006F22847|nr:hypothetical protein [Methylobacterium sp. Leaf469]KQU03560.1 hypothetical protein ASG60_17050 [Methylobacterium sp. Leaf469]